MYVLGMSVCMYTCIHVCAYSYAIYIYIYIYNKFYIIYKLILRSDICHFNKINCVILCKNKKGIIHIL